MWNYSSSIILRVECVGALLNGCLGAQTISARCSKGTNQSRASNHVAALKVGVTQNSHDSGANDEIFNTCNYIAIWLSDQKYHGFQLCDLCIRISEKLQNPKLSPANEEPSER